MSSPEIKVVESRKARRIVDKHSVSFFCGISSKYDIPVAIPKTKTQLTYSVEAPFPVYYSVKECKNYYYIIYALYHTYDPVARHKHDFEGELLVVNKTDRLGCYRAVMVNHNKLIFTELGGFSPYVEAGSHAISPHMLSTAAATLFICTTRSHLINMNSSKFDWLATSAILAPWAHLPDKWFDRSLENYVRKRRPTILGKRLTTTKGLFWRRPDILIALAEKRGKIK